MKSFLRYLLIPTMLFLMSCGEEKKEEPQRPRPNPSPTSPTALNCDPTVFSSPSNPVGYSVIDLQAPVKLVNFTDGTTGYVSDPLQFPLPVGTISFALQVYGDETLFRLLSDPRRALVFRGAGLGAINPRFRSDTACSSTILVPKKNGVATPSGNWTYRIQSKTPNPRVKLVVRTGNLPPRATITVKPYLTGARYTVANIQQALNRLVQIYRPHDIDLDLEAVQPIREPQYSIVSEDFNNSRTAALVSRGAAGKVNVFFVEDLDSPLGQGGFSTVGIAPGIPGSLGLQSRYNGVLVGLEQNSRGGGLNTNALAETAAHEMGHFLGLFHTTERDGRMFDILPDTPQCPIVPFGKGSNQVTVQDCVARDGLNLMFWVGSSRHNQTQLSAQQIEVIKKSPIAR